MDAVNCAGLTLRSICGVLSWKETDYAATTTEVGDVQTQQDWCQTTPYTDSNGTPMGETIFVAWRGGDNGDNSLLDFCWQTPIYLIEGVSKDETMHQKYLDAHVDFDMTKEVLTTAVIECERNQAPYDQGPIEPGCNPYLPSGMPLLPTNTKLPY